jgi:hypothetical protein
MLNISRLEKLKMEGIYIIIFSYPFGCEAVAGAMKKSEWFLKCEAI